jgi:tetratricopeptide (TPR) repeat protein
MRSGRTLAVYTTILLTIGALAFSALTAEGAEQAADPVDEKIAAACQEVAYINLEKAHALFVEAKAMAKPGSPKWDEAIFGEATCVWHLLPISRSNAEEAFKLFTQLVNTCPKGKCTPRALMSLGRILELPEDRDDPIDLPGAREWYQKVKDGWPNDPIAGEATLRIAGTYIQTYDDAQMQQGIKLLRGWLDTHPSEPLASIMWQYLADTYFFPLKDFPKALDAWEKVDALGWTEQGLQGKDYWRIATMSEKLLHNRDAAIKYYTKIIKETPNSGKFWESRLALERLGAPVPPTLQFLAPDRGKK